MHGTGTQADDSVKMQSVLETFAPISTRQPRQDNQPLYLESAKANIGHGEVASGVTSLAKVLLMMKNNTIPPHYVSSPQLTTNSQPICENAMYSLLIKRSRAQSPKMEFAECSSIISVLLAETVRYFSKTHLPKLSAMKQTLDLSILSRYLQSAPYLFKGTYNHSFHFLTPVLQIKCLCQRYHILQLLVGFITLIA